MIWDWKASGSRTSYRIQSCCIGQVQPTSSKRTVLFSAEAVRRVSHEGPCARANKCLGAEKRIRRIQSLA